MHRSPYGRVSNIYQHQFNTGEIIMVIPSDNLATSNIEILSTRKTKTISGKSDLTYHIGKDEEANQYIRIWVNSGNGYFSNEWIPVTKIIEILERHEAEPFTSIVFSNLFTGKSVNTPSFLSAAIQDAGMLKLAEGSKRKFVFTGAELNVDKASPRKKATKKSSPKPARKTSK
jgi:hypothetical protein